MNKYIKDKERFLVFDINGQFYDSLNTEECNQIQVRKVGKEQIKGWFVIDAINLLEEDIKVVYDIDKEVAEIESIFNLIIGTLKEVIKAKNTNSGKYTIIINGINIDKCELEHLKDEGIKKDIEIIKIK